MSKIAMYMRLSVEEYGKAIESESIISQRLIINDYIFNNEKLKLLDKEEYIDDGYSGTNTNRPSFQKLLKDVKNNEISCIIVKDLSRFLRDYILLGDYLENIFPFMNVRFISINDRYDSNNGKGNGTDLDIQFKSLLYDFYSKDISDKVKTAMSIQRKNGKFLAWNPPIGYIKDPNDKYKIIVDKKTVHIVKEIFDLSLQGFSIKEITQKLNEKGYITPANRKIEIKNINYSYILHKGVWNKGTVIDILNNENYTGTYVFEMVEKTTVGGNKYKPIEQEKWGRVFNHHEAIISYDVFNESKRIRAINDKCKLRNTNYEWYKKSPLQTIIKCATCGHILSCEVTKRRLKDGTLVKYKYFRCGFCRINNKEINSNNAKILEDKIYQIIKEKLEKDSLENKTKINDNKKDLLHMIEKLESEKQIAYEKYKFKKITVDVFIQLKIEKNKEIENINQRLNILNKNKNNNMNININEHNILTRELIENYFDSVYVFNNKITEVKWKC